MNIILLPFFLIFRIQLEFPHRSKIKIVLSLIFLKKCWCEIFCPSIEITASEKICSFCNVLYAVSVAKINIFSLFSFIQAIFLSREGPAATTTAVFSFGKIISVSLDICFKLLMIFRCQIFPK